MTKNIEDYKLCFVETLGDDCIHILFFTPFDARNVTGDDWGDVPYEHNASQPYCARLGSYKDIHSKKETASVLESLDGKLVKVILYSEPILGVNSPYIGIETPCSNVLNSEYSVEDINNGEVPWIVATWFSNVICREEKIMANATYKEVVEKLGDVVYLPKTRKNLTANEFLGSNWREGLENVEDGWD
jgi:hypothetical protein